MRIRVRVSGHQQFGRLARRFRAAADGALQRDLTDGIQRAAPPVLTKIRARVQGASFPAAAPAANGGGRSTGLRSRLAAATKTQPLAAPPGIRFYVDGSTVVPGDGRGGHALARYTDVELAHRWRHPVFGNSEAWIQQIGDPWFAVSIRPEEPRFRRSVEQAMDKTAQRIMS